MDPTQEHRFWRLIYPRWQISGRWRSRSVPGNEGQEALHQQGRLSAFRQELGIELAVDVYETSVNLQFWKRYQDVVDLVLLAPDQSQVFRFLDSEQGVGEGQIASYVWNNTEIHVFFDAPSPYQIYQEIYFAFCQGRIMWMHASGQSGSCLGGSRMALSSWLRRGKSE